MREEMRAARLGGRGPDPGSLVSAWEAGLTKIVIIPCEGVYARKIAPTAMLVTTTTRLDPDAFKSALANFI